MIATRYCSRYCIDLDFPEISKPKGLDSSSLHGISCNYECLLVLVPAYRTVPTVLRVLVLVPVSGSRTATHWFYCTVQY